jgi:hypothetical protein
MRIPHVPLSCLLARAHRFVPCDQQLQPSKFNNSVSIGGGSALGWVAKALARFKAMAAQKFADF